MTYSSWYVYLSGSLATLFFVCYFYVTRNFKYWKNRGIPYEEPLPFFGNFLNVIFGIASPGQQLQHLYNKYDLPYFGIFVLDKPCLLVKSTDIIKEVLVKEFSKFPNRMFAVDEQADSLTYNSLLAIPIDHWKYLRSKLTPVFTSGKMKMMFLLMKECGEDLNKYIGSALEQTIEMKEVSAKFTTDLISSCAFGIKTNSLEVENSDFYIAGKKIFTFNLSRSVQFISYFFAPSLVKAFKFKFVHPESATFFRNIFWATVHKREETNFQRNDLIDILIKLRKQEDITDKYKLDGDRLVSQVVTFFGAGQETTGSTIAFAIYELGLNPNIQSHLRAEIKRVLAKYGSITYEAIQDMKYLDMVISETLRKYPVAPFLNRQCVEDHHVPGTDLIIEKGVPVFMSLLGLHHDPQYYLEPEKFNPERFSEKNNIHPYTYMPFGVGPRFCLGDRFGLLGSKVGLAYILKDFEILSTIKTPIPVTLNPRALLLQSAFGLPMKFKKL